MHRALGRVFSALGLLALVACSPADDCTTRLDVMMAYEAASFFERELDGPMDESTEGASVVQYRDNDNALRRVTVSFFGETGRRVLDYRLLDRNNYALVEQTFTYARPIDPATPTHAAAPVTVMVQVCDGEEVASQDPVSARLREDLSLAEDFIRDPLER